MRQCTYNPGCDQKFCSLKQPYGNGVVEAGNDGIIRYWCKKHGGACLYNAPLDKGIIGYAQFDSKREPIYKGESWVDAY